MSRSLSRIRHLISEIEEIQRQGQQGAKVGVDRPPLERAPMERAPVERAPMERSHFERPAFAEIRKEAISEITPDPFDEIANLVDLDTKRIAPADHPSQGKVSLQLSGQVAISIQIADSGEKVELKQVGNRIEIRFADGKAFHIPFKAVA